VSIAERFSLIKPLPLSALNLGVKENKDRYAIAGVARFWYAQKGDLCFCDKEPSTELIEVPAGVLILCSDVLINYIHRRYPDVICIPAPDPRSSFIDLGHKLLEQQLVEVSNVVPRPFGIHPSVVSGAQTVIHPEVRIDEGAVIGAQCVIHRGAWIQKGATIRDNATIGAVGINAYRGLDGRQRTFPHFASAIIGEDVEIGAGAVVVRGILNSTRIGKGSVIGNLCNIGHGVEIAEKAWMSVGCLIGGHTKVGVGATLGMGAVVRDNIEIGANAQIGMGSVVVKSVKANTSMFGNPARATGTIQAGPAR
jgi:UDP-3-O-[3-hydroxymyristoyl] glucosamine N-acyltransferase